MNFYSQADYLRDLYGVHFSVSTNCKSGQKLEVSLVNNEYRPIWSSPEDIVGSVVNRAYRQIKAKITKLKDFEYSAVTKPIDVNRLEEFYLLFSDEEFDKFVLPYCKESDSTELVNYATEYEIARKEMPDLSPKNTPVNEMYKWGKIFNAVSKIYTKFREANDPPIILADLSQFPSSTITSIEAIRKWSEDQAAAPINGEKFEQWEIEALKVAYPKIKFQHAEGKEFAVKSNILDVFTLIGSNWFVPPEVPTLNPVAHKVFVREEVEDGSTQPQGVGLPPALDAASFVAATGTKIYNFNDGYDDLREKLHVMAYCAFDINILSTVQKDELKAGGPNPIGVRFYKSMTTAAKKTFASKIPVGKNSFPYIVEHLAKTLKTSDKIGLATYLANKLILCKAQFPCSKGADGDLYFEKN